MDYFQKLSIADTFTRVGHIFASKWSVFLCISVLAYFLYFAASVMTVFILASFIDYSHQSDLSDPSHVIATLVNNAVYYAVMCLADGAIIRAVAEMYVGQVPTVDSTLQYGMAKLYPLFANAVLIGAAVGFPAILVLLFLVWISGGAQIMVILFDLVFLGVALWVVVVTYHTYAVIMVEDGGIMDSIQRSYDLSQGSRCHIFSLLFLLAAAKFVLYLICNIIAATGGPVEIIFQMVHLCISIVFATLGSILQAVVYVSLRADKEGLSHQVLVTELFGPVQEDGKTSYVAASAAEEGMPAAGMAPPPSDNNNNNNTTTTTTPATTAPAVAPAPAAEPTTTTTPSDPPSGQEGSLV